ncbi:hypothetical protein KGQ71_03645, partial [Patescibacteria group bacterium]|nr:hypothetical protein [Patescibacteria group bacterium]
IQNSPAQMESFVVGSYIDPTTHFRVHVVAHNLVSTGNEPEFRVELPNLREHADIQIVDLRELTKHKISNGVKLTILIAVEKIRRNLQETIRKREEFIQKNGQR